VFWMYHYSMTIPFDLCDMRLKIRPGVSDTVSVHELADVIYACVERALAGVSILIRLLSC
jgi:hypothetical protein